MADRSLVLAAGSMLDVDAPRLIDVAAAAGFDGVGLRLTVDDRGRPVEIDALAAYAAHAADRGLAIHDVEVYRMAPSAPDAGPLIDAAATLGATAVLVVSDLADLGATQRRLDTVVERCRAAGIVAGLEYMAWTTPANPDDALRMAVATGAVLVADLLHHHRVGAGVGELTAVVSSGSLGWVQLADAPARPPGDLIHEARHARLPPGEGDLPLAQLLAVVPDDVTISVEVQSDRLRRRYPPGERAALLARSARTVLGSHRS